MNKFYTLVGYSEEKKTSVKTEIIAGIVTFLAMAYILTVNPNSILYAGTADARWSSLFMATAFGAIVGTLLMAFLAKMPLAQASGMGLNSLLGGVIGGGVSAFSYGFNFTIGQAFMMVLISGMVFFLLSVIKIKGKTFRELVFDGMPVAVRSAISVGIGLFIAYIGFQNAGIIVTNGYTQVAFVDFTKWGDQVVNYLSATGTWAAAKTAIVAFVGLFSIAILDKLNVKGSVIIGILVATIVGIPFGVTNLKVLAGNDQISWKFWENFGNFFAGENSVFGSFTDVFTEGFPAGSLFTVIMLIITMCMIDMFDTMGTIVGCCGGNRILSDENNKPYNYGKIMICDAVATCSGAMLGTSTVTTFVESGAGVSAGGRTGLTAFTTACMFFLAIFIMPVFATIPSAATASALIYVGVLMMKNNVKNIDFNNAVNATCAFLTIAVMVLSYSITKGIGVGMVSYVIMSSIAYVIELIKWSVTKDKNSAEPVEGEEGAEVVKAEKPVWNVSVVAIIVSVLFLVYFFVPTTL
ncbi:MAG: NCS2 family permease [Clostridia bacterium]|nr:NCS2 family permease [Clostridia bacterium]